MSYKTYTQDLHNTALKHPGSKPTPEVSEPEPYEPYDLGQIPSRIPLQEAAQLPPAHLELLAYKMASKKLPATVSRSKARKTHSWSPKKHNPAILKSSTGGSRKQPTEHSMAYDAAVDTEHFAKNMLRTGLEVPVSFFYQLANGFHNAPSFILHDETVRRRDDITGFGSGLKVAAKGFGYNLFDGLTGIITQPYMGYQKDGLEGMAKGVGKGAGGLVFKTLAAVIGIPGYSLKGLERQLAKRLDRGVKAKVLEVRLRQGLIAYSRATKDEKDEILARWKEFGPQAAGLE
jgi:sterol 3beta-glucosyltransferase